MKKITIWSLLLCTLFFIICCKSDNLKEKLKIENIQREDTLADFSITLKDSHTINIKPLEEKASVITSLSVFVVIITISFVYYIQYIYTIEC